MRRNYSTLHCGAPRFPRGAKGPSRGPPCGTTCRNPPRGGSSHVDCPIPCPVHRRSPLPADWTSPSRPCRSPARARDGLARRPGDWPATWPASQPASQPACQPASQPALLANQPASLASQSASQPGSQRKASQTPSQYVNPAERHAMSHSTPAWMPAPHDDALRQSTNPSRYVVIITMRPSRHWPLRANAVQGK